MKQEKVKVELLPTDSETDILRFYVGASPLDVNLNSPECQTELKNIFSVLLKTLIDADIELELSVNDNYPRIMYKEVCTEYIIDLNRELTEIKEEIATRVGGVILGLMF